MINGPVVGTQWLVATNSRALKLSLTSLHRQIKTTCGVPNSGYSQPSQGSTRTTTCDLSIAPNLNAIHKHMSHAFRCQLGFLKRGAIDNRFGIEHNQISFESNANHTAILQLESLRGKRRHLADGLRQCQPVILTNITSEHAWVCAGAAWMA